MKKKIFLLTTILAASAMLFLSSCLKDKSHYVNFGDSGTWVNFPKGGPSNFGGQAITESPDTDALGTIVRKFAVNIASPELQKAATTVTFKVNDQATVDAYNKSQTLVVYDLMPTDAYKIGATKVVIEAGQLVAYDSVTFYKNKLDPSKSYMLPITIESTTNGKLTANLNTLLYHFIGNDFAGNYEQFFDRWAGADTSAANAAHKDVDHEDLGENTFFPVTPNEFTVTTAYYSGPPYTVTFTKTGNGATATYSNFQVDFPADVIADYFTNYQPGTVVTLVHHPEIRPQDGTTYDPDKQYTYAEALKLFRFYYTTATRAVIDTWVKE